MLNLNTTHSLTQPSQRYAPNALPVLVDLNWHGKVMTSPNAGIVTSQAMSDSVDREVVL